MTKRVLVVDDHALFREGIVSLLTVAGFVVVGQVGDGEAAVQAVLRLKPDLVLLDINLPAGMDGLDTLRRIREVDEEAQVVILTASENNAHLVTAVRYGACGYMLKTLDSKGFIASLQGLERGEAALSRFLTAQLMESLNRAHRVRPSSDAATEDELSERELEMLRYVSAGLTSKLIAEKAGITENTVKYHVKNILRKLNVQNRAEAVAYAVQIGLISTIHDPD